MFNTLKSTKQIASELQVNVRTVQKWCQLLEFERVGKSYSVSENDIFELSLKIQKTVGRPKVYLNGGSNCL